MRIARFLLINVCCFCAIDIKSQEAFYFVGQASLKSDKLHAVINAGSSIKNNTFTVQKNGAIWLFVSLSTFSHTIFTVNVMIRNHVIQPISSSSLGYSKSLSANWFGLVNKEDTIFLQSDISIMSNLQSEVLFLGIHLDGTTMSPFVALVVEGSTDCHSTKLVNYNTIIRSNWNDTIHYYKITIPVSGIYFISIYFQAEGCNNTTLSEICVIAFGMIIKKAGEWRRCLQIWKAITGDKFDEESTIISTSYMYRFNVQDEIILQFHCLNLLNSFTYHFVLYEPLHQMKVAWALNDESKNYGKLQFPEVNINEGNLWDVFNYQLKIPVNGLYFIALHTKIDGSVENFLKVVCNSKQSIITIRVKANNEIKPNYFITTISQSALANLKQGDTLHVEAWKSALAILFSGFLLYLL